MSPQQEPAMDRDDDPWAAPVSWWQPLAVVIGAAALVGLMLAAGWGLGGFLALLSGDLAW